MVQSLRACIALAEDPSLGPSTYLGWLHRMVMNSTLYSVLQDCMVMGCIVHSVLQDCM